MAKPEKTVETYLAGLSGERQQVALALRGLIRKAAPGLNEAGNWNCPWYVGTGNVCSIMAFRDHVNLAFFRGSELEDKNKLLEGTGKGMRHVKVMNLKDLRKQAVAQLVTEADQLDRNGDE